MIKMYIHNGSGNHGCEAILRSTVKMFDEDIVLYSSNPSNDSKYNIDKILDLRYDAPLEYEKSSFKYLKAAIHHKLTKTDYIFNTYQHDALLQSISKEDICFSIGGDNYCYAGVDILADVNKAIHKKGAKTVLWGCSIEEDVLNDPFIVEDMKRYDLITARESITVANLKKAGITDNVVFCSDPAFQLDIGECKLPEGFDNKNTIGINVSPLATESGNQVLKNYEQLIRYILSEKDYKVLLIPHVVWESTDDRETLKKLYNIFKDTGRILLEDDYNCLELKSLISQCRMFIGARTHATIAAYSTCVPTLVAGYSVKARGIAKDIFGNDENYVIPVQNFKDENSLRDSFIWIEEHENEIREYLKKTMPEYCQKSYIAVEAVKRLMEA